MVLVLVFFLGRPAMALLVALTIPFALLFALGMMYLTNIPIGLLSIGAIDFGIIVYGAVIMAENIARRLGESGRRDPRGTLAEVFRILRPGGRLVVAVPNFSSAQARWAGPAWFHLDLPRHLFHFPLLALVQLLERGGFAIESVHHLSLRQNPFGWIQSALNMTTLPRNGLYTLLHDRAAHAGGPAFGPMTQLKLLAGGALAVLPALLLTLIDAWFHTGATVHVVARAAAAARPGA